MSTKLKKEVCELEDQFILRLPKFHADIVRKTLQTRHPKSCLKISINDDYKTGTVFINGQPLYSKIVDLPCVVDSNKTIDKSILFKTANVSQMMLCQEEKYEETEQNPNGKKNVYIHGIAPPMKNVRKQRFRRMLAKERDFEDEAEIQNEVITLLRADNDAVSSRFEFISDDKKPLVVNERILFGEIITDSESEDDSPKSKTN